MDKIKNIELFRIIGCLSVIILHFVGLKSFLSIPHYTFLNEITRNGNKAVDLFFILSGFFFMLGFKRTLSLWEFVKKKFIRLYPVILFTALVSLILPFVRFEFNEVLITILGLNGTPLALKLGFMSHVWYVSALFWTLLFLFYILKNFEEKNVDLLLACSIFLCYGCIIHCLGGKICSHSKFYYFINIGTLRALGGISIGYFIAKLYKNCKQCLANFAPNLFQKLLISIVEGYCLFFIVQNLLFHNLKFDNQIIFIIIFTISIILFLLNKGLFSYLFNNNIVCELSKYTYSIYIVHRVFIDGWRQLYKIYPEFINSHGIMFVLSYISATILFGILTYYLIEEPSVKYLKKKYLTTTSH